MAIRIMLSKAVSLMAAVILVATAVIVVANAQRPTREVETQYGKVQGLMVDGTQQYLGIPFAAPPLRDLRWKAPAAPEKWSGVFKAHNFSAGCMASGPFLIPEPFSEDCLYLNVWTPERANASFKFPVRVWIYGGGYQSGATMDYPANILSVASDSVIVSINYRLNVFGFFGLPQLRKESAALNYGLQDQQVGLQWVKDNIHNFGGDPSNVLIFGESAGGGSVAFHLLMKRSWPLFHKAIAESPGEWIYPSLAQVEDSSIAIANSTTCSTSKPEDMLTCLRGLSAADILKAPATLISFMLPVADKVQVMDQPMRLFKSGQFATDKSVIIGSNYAEGNLFAMLFGMIYLNVTVNTLTEPQYEVLMNTTLGPYGPSVLPWYADLASKEGYWHAYSQALGDYYINCGAILMADSIAAAHKDKPDVSTYKYLFAQHTQGGLLGQYNATHGMEIPYVFANPKIFNNGPPFTKAESALSDDIIAYWTDFHRTGSPNRHGKPVWPRYAGNDAKQNTIIVLDTPVSFTTEWDKDFCAKWTPVMLSALA